MSGICGMLALKGQRPDDAILMHMAEMLTHRGPDDLILQVDGPCGLAHTYLMQDESAPFGVQPLRVRYEAGDQAAQAWIACDGEVLNHAEVRAALQASGQVFSSDTSAETILCSYLKFGDPHFVKAFRGIFAFCIWDAGCSRLLLVRDRLGQKPLYYIETADWLVFASEIKALLAHPAVPRRLNESMVPHYLAYGYPPAPDTLFAGIKAVPPGCRLTRSLGSEVTAPHIEAYWQPPYPFSGRDLRSEQNIAADLLAHLRGAVRARIQDGRPVAALLSGGLDSAAVVALLAQESRQTIHTFSACFAGEQTFDDTRYARQVAGRFVTDHHEIVLDLDALDAADLAEQLVLHHDQPFGDPTAVATYLICQQVYGHARSVLTGDGGDELFAGHASFRLAQIARNYNQLPGVAHRAIGGVFEWLLDTSELGDWVQQASRVVQTAGLTLPERYLQWVRSVPGIWLIALLGGQNEGLVQRHFEAYFSFPRAEEKSDVVAQLLDVNLRTHLPDSLLVRLDRCGMAAPVEIQTPFLDHQLVHFVAAIPSTLKVRRGSQKYILKQALRTLLPETVIERRQQSFTVPVDAWLRGSLAGFAREVLLGQSGAPRRMVDREAVRAMLDTHLSGKADLGQPLWTLLTLELWAKLYLS